MASMAFSSSCTLPHLSGLNHRSNSSVDAAIAPKTKFRSSTSYRQSVPSSSIAPQPRPLLGPAPKQEIVRQENFPFGSDKEILARGRFHHLELATEITNQHSYLLTNMAPKLNRKSTTTELPALKMFSDATTDNTLLDPTTQAQFSAASSPAPGSATPARLTIIGAAELETLRKNNRILRANNVSIMKMKTEMEARVLAAETRVEILEKELREVKGGF